MFTEIPECKDTLTVIYSQIDFISTYVKLLFNGKYSVSLAIVDRILDVTFSISLNSIPIEKYRLDIFHQKMIIYDSICWLLVINSKEFFMYLSPKTKSYIMMNVCQ